MRNICLILYLSCTLNVFGQLKLLTNTSTTNVGITGTIDGVYINEFHYDNTGSDLGEFVEVAGPAGTDLSSYTITLYNGGDDSKYHTLTLSGTIDNEGSETGAVMFSISGIQNGNPDGIALSKSGSTSVQFLSYEGTITAADGDSNGVLSVDIGVKEDSSTPTGHSLEYNEGTTSWVTVTNDSPGDYVQGAILSTSQPQIRRFKLYPVPAPNAIINISSSLNTPMNITIYDLSGQQLFRKTISSNRLDVSMLNSGIYILKASQDQASTIKKLIIP